MSGVPRKVGYFTVMRSQSKPGEPLKMTKWRSRNFGTINQALERAVLLINAGSLAMVVAYDAQDRVLMVLPPLLMRGAEMDARLWTTEEIETATAGMMAPF